MVAGILVWATPATFAEEKHTEEYSLSPAKGIVCTVRPPNPDGSRDAVGADFTDQHLLSIFSVETVRIYHDGIVHYAWMVDRDTGEVSAAEYRVFRTHCAPLMEQLPSDLRKKFDGFFAN